jgi:hypothetical protein
MPILGQPSHFTPGDCFLQAADAREHEDGQRAAGQDGPRGGTGQRHRAGRHAAGQCGGRTGRRGRPGQGQAGSRIFRPPRQRGSRRHDERHLDRRARQPRGAGRPCGVNGVGAGPRKTRRSQARELATVLRHQGHRTYHAGQTLCTPDEHGWIVRSVLRCQRLQR